MLVPIKGSEPKPVIVAEPNHKIICWFAQQQQQQQQQQQRILASTILDEAFKKQHELRSFGRMLSGTC